eukprot:3181290-Pyramimonas_sp.AAC.4
MAYCSRVWRPLAFKKWRVGGGDDAASREPREIFDPQEIGRSAPGVMGVVQSSSEPRPFDQPERRLAVEGEEEGPSQPIMSASVERTPEYSATVDV